VQVKDWEMRREITQTVTVYLPSSTQLFAAPEPIRVPGFSSRATISFDQGQVTSMSTLNSQKTLRAGNVYQMVSNVSRADPDSLRGAGEDYADWIERRYLQLPGTVTDRTRALAADITAGYDSAFDKAEAIEQYLRLNLTYDLSVPAPPEGQDFVDFALFDLQAGYCDYYASSFVVLARAAGIPSRLAMGYAQSEYDEDAKAYRVRAHNGHSWPEIFFPEYGWIQFEPTVIIDPIEWPEPRRSSNSSGRAGPLSPNPYDDIPGMDDRFPEEPGMFDNEVPYYPQFESRGPSPIFLALSGLLVLAIVSVGFTYWFTEKRGTSGLSFVERAYSRMWRFASWLGVPSPPDQTPYERADALTSVVPEGGTIISGITGMYVVEKFGRGNRNNDDSYAEDQWSLLRPMLWKSWVQKKFGWFQRPQQRRWSDLINSDRTVTQDDEKSRSG
jgi:hypothetical protein